MQPTCPDVLTRLLALGCVVLALGCREEVPRVAAVRLSPSTLTLHVGERAQLELQLTSASGEALEGRAAHWSSDAPEIAGVDEEGEVRAVAAGEVRISVEVEGLQASARVEVLPPPAVARVEVLPSALSLKKGQRERLEARSYDAGGWLLSGRTTQWSTDDASVAQVDAEGWVTAVGPGTTSLRAEVDGQRGSARVDVAPGPVASVVLEPGPEELDVGGRLQLVARAFDADGFPVVGLPVAWATGAPAVATVDERGWVEGLTAGSVALTATIAQKSASRTLLVAPAVQNVRVGPDTAELLVGDTLPLELEALDVEGQPVEGRKVVWESSAPHVAGVDAEGRVTALAGGEATLRVTVGGRTAAAHVTVVQLRFRALAAGGATTCGLTPEGVAYCWGAWAGADYDSSQFSARPARLLGTTPLAQVAVGQTHVCVLTTEGEALCRGPNDGGQLGNDTTQGSVALVPVSGGLRFQQLVASGRHSCGLTAGGEAWCWGVNDSGELGTGSTQEAHAPVRVAGGLRFQMLTTWGDSMAGASTTCGLTLDSEAWCWGDNSAGQLGDDTSTSSSEPVRVAGGLRFSTLANSAEYIGQRPGQPKSVAAHTCGVGVDGSASCWGRNLTGELGTGTMTPSAKPQPVVGGHLFRALATGAAFSMSFTCGVTQERAVLCWGANAYGQLGDGTFASHPTPGPVSGSLSAESVAAGVQHACALATDGRVWCWGSNEVGQLGAPTALPSSGVPFLVYGQE